MLFSIFDAGTRVIGHGPRLSSASAAVSALAQPGVYETQAFQAFEGGGGGFALGECAVGGAYAP